MKWVKWSAGIESSRHGCSPLLLSHHWFRYCCLLPSSVQSLSRVWLFATPWTVARQASLSITNSRNLLKLMSIEPVMPSNHLILCRPLLRFPAACIFPSCALHTHITNHWFLVLICLIFLLGSLQAMGFVWNVYHCPPVLSMESGQCGAPETSADWPSAHGPQPLHLRLLVSRLQSPFHFFEPPFGLVISDSLERDPFLELISYFTWEYSWCAKLC